jgi:hypothetical protein
MKIQAAAAAAANKETGAKRKLPSIKPRLTSDKSPLRLTLKKDSLTFSLEDSFSAALVHDLIALELPSQDMRYPTIKLKPRSSQRRLSTASSSCSPSRLPSVSPALQAHKVFGSPLFASSPQAPCSLRMRPQSRDPMLFEAIGFELCSVPTDACPPLVPLFDNENEVAVTSTPRASSASIVYSEPPALRFVNQCRETLMSILYCCNHC